MQMLLGLIAELTAPLLCVLRVLGVIINERNDAEVPSSGNTGISQVLLFVVLMSV